MDSVEHIKPGMWVRIKTWHLYEGHKTLVRKVREVIVSANRITVDAFGYKGYSIPAHEIETFKPSKRELLEA